MANRPGRIAVLGLAAALAAGVRPASAVRHPFRSYRNVDGLPQSQVIALAQDRRGELWVGTWCGAARYDGARFHYVTSAVGLRSDYIDDIVEDRAGNIWLAAGWSLARFDPKDLSKPAEVIVPLRAGPNDGTFRDLLADSQGNLWALSKGAGLVRRAPDGSISVIPAGPADPDSTHLLVELSDGRILVGGELGLFEVGVGALLPFRAGGQAGAGRIFAEPIRMLGAAGDRLFVGSESALHEIRLPDGDPVEILGASGKSIARSRFAQQDRTGRLFIGTETGLERRGPDGMLHLGMAEGLPNERLYSMLEDREGNLWFGTDNGLAKYPGELFRSFGKGEGLERESVWSVSVGRDGSIWAGTVDGAFHQVGDRFVSVPGAVQGKTVRMILDVGEIAGSPHSGSIFFGTRNDGLFELHGGTWRQYLPPEVPDRRFYGAIRTSDSTLWFCTRSGLVEIRSDGARKIWTRKDGLPDDTVWMVREDPMGRILAATDSGIARLERGRFVVGPDLQRFLGTTVRSICLRPDPHGGPPETWLGTNGLGVFRRKGDGEWTRLAGGKGPSDDFVWGMTVDALGRVWIGTNHGLDLWDGSVWTNFSERDGLASDEIAVNAIAAAPDGGVWCGFGSAAGLVRFDPHPFTAPPAAPIVRITSLVTAERAFDSPASLSLPYAERDFTISFIGTSFRDERKVTYRTKLDGYDADWSEPASERTARYTNLEPGKYAFLVRAAGAGAVWTETPARVEIEIAAPVWATWWFRAIVAALLVLVVVGIVRWWLSRAEEEKRRLEETIRERTRALEEKVQQVEDLRKKYERLSVTDPLTGLANRRFFVEQIEREIVRAVRHREAIGLLLIDLDHFKDVNDRHGHHAGDAVLVAFARLLEGFVRKSDLIARWGGEEFMIAYLNTDQQGSFDRAEELRRQLESTRIDGEGHSLRITLSAGFLWCDFSGTARELGFDDLARAADHALYRAKGRGRNRIEMAGDGDLLRVATPAGAGTRPASE